jgi:hypothetical protein
VVPLARRLRRAEPGVGPRRARTFTHVAIAPPMPASRRLSPNPNEGAVMSTTNTIRAPAQPARRRPTRWPGRSSACAAARRSFDGWSTRSTQAAPTTATPRSARSSGSVRWWRLPAARRWRPTSSPATCSRAACASCSAPGSPTTTRACSPSPTASPPSASSTRCPTPTAGFRSAAAAGDASVPPSPIWRWMSSCACCSSGWSSCPPTRRTSAPGSGASRRARRRRDGAAAPAPRLRRRAGPGHEQAVATIAGRMISRLTV